MPILKRIHVEKKGVRYTNGEIVISVTLFGKIKPVETVIYVEKGL